MTLRMIIALVFLALLALPAFQQAIALAFNSRFGVALLF